MLHRVASRLERLKTVKDLDSSRSFKMFKKPENPVNEFPKNQRNVSNLALENSLTACPSNDDDSESKNGNIIFASVVVAQAVVLFFNF